MVTLSLDDNKPSAKITKQRYFEFVQHEYYGLIAVHIDDEDTHVIPYQKAAELYLRDIGGDSVQEILNEATPLERTKEYAFMKFIYASTHETVKKAIYDFESTTNGALLIDGSLI